MRALAIGVNLLVLAAYLVYLEGRLHHRRARRLKVSRRWIEDQQRRARTETPNAWRLHRGGHWRT